MTVNQITEGKVKKCVRCGEEKDLTGFSKNNNGNRSGTCHSCRRKIRRENRRKRQKKVLHIIENKKDTKKVDKRKEVYYYQQPNSKILDEVTKEEVLSLLEIGAIVMSEEENVFTLVSRKLLRQYILLRDKYKCAYCGEWGDTIDHIHPRSDGGEDSPNNLVCACQSCNVMKSNMHLNDFHEFLYDQIIEMEMEIEKRKDMLGNVQDGMARRILERYKTG